MATDPNLHYSDATRKVRASRGVQPRMLDDSQDDDVDPIDLQPDEAPPVTPTPAPQERRKIIGTTGGEVPQQAGTWDKPPLNVADLSDDLATRRQQIIDETNRRKKAAFERNRPFAPSTWAKDAAGYEVRQVEREVAADYQDLQRRQRQDAIAQRRQQKFDQKTRNAELEAQYRSTGQQFYTDSFGNLQPIVDAESGRQLYHETAWEPGEHPKDGRPVKVKRDKYGQRQFKNYPLITSDDPMDDKLYWKDPDGEDRYPAMTIDEAIASPDITIAKRGLAARKAKMSAERREAIVNMELLHDSVNTQFQSQAALAIAKREQARQLSEAGAPPEEVARFDDEAQAIEDSIKPGSGALWVQQQIATKALMVEKIRAKRDAYALQREERMAHIIERGGDPATDPLLKENDRFLETYDAQLKQAEASEKEIERLMQPEQPRPAQPPQVTTGQKLAVAGANVLEGAGTGLVDMAEAGIRNLRRAGEAGPLTTFMGPAGAAVRFAGKLMPGEALTDEMATEMRNAAAAWGPDLPPEIKKQLEEAFLTGTAPKALGSALSFMAPSGAAGAAARAIGMTGKALAGVVTATVAALGAGASGNAFRREAEAALRKQLNAGEITQQEFEQSLGFAEAFGSLLGTTEAVPLSRFVQRMGGTIAGKTFIGKMFEKFARGSEKGALKWLMTDGADALAEAIEEGGQEFIQAISQDLYASQTFDPGREIGKSAPEQAGAGGFVGALLSILSKFVRVRGGPSAPQAEPPVLEPPAGGTPPPTPPAGAAPSPVPVAPAPAPAAPEAAATPAQNFPVEDLTPAERAQAELEAALNPPQEAPAAPTETPVEPPAAPVELAGISGNVEAAPIAEQPQAVAPETPVAQPAPVVPAPAPVAQPAPAPKPVRTLEQIKAERAQKGLGAANQTTPEKLEGEKINREWTAFSDESKSLGVPRAEMPQVKAEHRGALTNFLKGRGITSEEAEVLPGELKPTQAEYSQAKVDKARKFEGGDRAILVSSDGHVLDGHHQWMAKLTDSPKDKMRVIRLNAPIKDLIAQVKEFPSADVAKGATAPAPARTLEGVRAERAKRTAPKQAVAPVQPAPAPAPVAEKPAPAPVEPKAEAPAPEAPKPVSPAKGGRVREAAKAMVTPRGQPTFDVWNLAGPSMKPVRQKIMSTLLGRKATVAESGVTAIVKEMAAQLGVANNASDVEAAIKALVEAPSTEGQEVISAPQSPRNARTDAAPSTQQGSGKETVVTEKKKGKRIGVGLPASGEPDILNVIESFGGIKSRSAVENPGGEYDNQGEIYRGVARRLLRGKVKRDEGGLSKSGILLKEAGLSPDDMARDLHREGFLKDDHTTTLEEAVEQAVRNREKLNKQYARKQYEDRFELAFLGNGHARKWLRAGQPITVDDLNVGDEFEVEKEKFKVTAIDEDGNVTIKDGITRTFEAGTPVYPDKGKVTKAKQDVEFVPEEPAAPLELESVTNEQQAKEAEERKAKEAAAKQREAVVEKAEKPLVGDSSNVGQGQLMAQDEDLFSGESEESKVKKRTLEGIKEVRAARADREAKIQEILAIARRPIPKIIEVFELKGTDGKWYRPNGFPFGVQHTGERRSDGFAIQSMEGSIVGQRAKTEQEIIDRHNAAQDEQMADFRKELESMPDDRFQSQYEFWQGEKAKQERLNAPMPPKRTLEGVKAERAAKGLGKVETPAEPAKPGVEPILITKENRAEADKADALFGVNQGEGKKQYTLWYRRLLVNTQTKASKYSQWYFIGNLGQNKAEAHGKAMEIARRIGRGDMTGVAFIGQDKFVQPKSIAVFADELGADVLQGIDRAAVGERKIGFGKNADVLLKDIWTKDPGWARWAAQNLDGKRGYVADYIKSLPEYIVEQEENKAASQSAMTPERTEALKRFEITPELIGNDIALTGKTYDWKETIKKLGGRWQNDRWTLPVGRYKEFVDTLNEAAKSVKKGEAVPGYLANPALKQMREASAALPDMSAFTEEKPITNYVQPDTVALLSRGEKVGMEPFVVKEQVEDVARINRAYQDGERLFVLASEPGSGKTFVLGGAIREMRRAGAKRIVYITLRKELITQIKGDLAEYGIGDVEFYTYSQLRGTATTKGIAVEPSDALIWDEAHAIKNVGDEENKVQQAEIAKDWIKQAKFTILSTATPFEDPTQAAYLEPTGIFDTVFGNAKNFALAHGAQPFTVKDGQGNILRQGVRWVRSASSDADAKAARDYFQKKGVFTSRRIRLPKAMVDSRLVKMDVSPEAKKLYDDFANAAAVHDEELVGLVKAQIVNLQKRLLEAAKVERGIQEAENALNRGRYPIIFVETKAERKIDIPDLIRREEEYNIAVGQALSMRERPPSRKDFGLPFEAQMRVYRTYMEQTGNPIIQIPSAEDVIVDHFGKDNVAVFTGSVTPKVAQENLDRWRASKKPMVIVATMAKGGTGLSLHDKKGNHPTTQVNINLPWSATQVVQVAQRSARYGLQSKAEMQWIFADNLAFDKILASRVGGRMATMGALVQGEKLAGSDNIENWDFEDASFADTNKPAPPPPDNPFSLTDTEGVTEDAGGEIMAQARDEIDDWQKANPKAPKVELVYQPEWLENGRGVKGQYRADGTLVVNAAYAESPADVANHEWAHDTLSTPNGKVALATFATRELPKTDLDSLLKKYPRQPGESIPDHRLRIVEEWVAKNAEKTPGLWTRMVEAVRRWLSRQGLVTLNNAEAARAMLRVLREQAGGGPRGGGSRSSLTDKDEGPSFGIKNAATAEQRAAWDLPPPREREGTTFEEARAEAKARFDADPFIGQQLVAELASNPRPLTAVENMILDHEIVRLHNERTAADRAYTKAVESNDAPAMQLAAERITSSQAAFEATMDVAEEVGTKSSESLYLRKAMLKADFSLAAITRKMKQAQGGKDLTKEQENEVRKLHEEYQRTLKDLEAKLERTESERAKAVFEVELLKIIKGVAAEPKRQVDPVEREKYFEAQANAAEKRIAAKRAKKPEYDPADINDYAIFAANLLRKAQPKTVAKSALTDESISSYPAEFEQGMIAKYGETIRPRLKEIYDRAMLANSLMESQVPGSRDIRGERKTTKERIKARVEDGDAITDLGPYVQRLAEQFVREGITERDPLINAVHRELNSLGLNVTKRETMDAISGYGKFTPLDQDEVKAKLRDLRGQMQQVGKLQDMQAGKAPAKTGQQRRTPSDEERRLIQQVEEAKRKGGFRVTDPAKQLKSALDAIKTRLRNSIADLDYQIATGKKIIQKKTGTPYDTEALTLKARREELKKQYDEMFGQSNLTDAQKLAIAEKAADRQIEDLERQLRTNELFAKSKAQPLTSPALEAKRARIAALKEEREYARHLIQPRAEPRSAEEIALQAYKASLTKRIAELQDRLARGDFAPRAKPPERVLDAEALRLKAIHEKAKSEVMRAIIHERMKNMSTSQKIYAGIRETMNLPRVAMSSWDVSAVLRQGGFIAMGHPKRAMQSIGPMFRALASEEQSNIIEQEILNRPNAPIYKRSKLYIAPHEVLSMSAMEEQTMSRFAKYLPGVKHSNRAYITFLNKLRADSFDAMYEAMSPEQRKNPKNLEAIANYINVATGRGNLGKASGMAENLATVFFSPRLLASRFQLLAGTPMMRGDDETRKMLAKEYIRFLTGIAVVLGLGAMAGAEIEKDPRSSDFLKLRFGNTRIDVLGGLGQVTTFLTRMLMGETKTAKGEIKPIRGNVEYGAQDSVKVLTNFIRSKLSPSVGAALNVASGTTVTGDEVTTTSQLKNLILPLSVQDIVEAMQAQGPAAGSAMAALALFGYGLQQYGADIEDISPEVRRTLNDAGLSAPIPDRPQVGPPNKKRWATDDEYERYRKDVGVRFNSLLAGRREMLKTMPRPKAQEMVSKMMEISRKTAKDKLDRTAR